MNVRAILVVSAFALVVAACAGAGGDAEESLESAAAGGRAQAAETTATTSASVSPAPTLAPELPESEAVGDAGIAAVAIQPADLGRDIIFTADLTLATRDVAAAGREVTRIVEGLGGFLFGQETRGEPDPMSILTFKVPPENFTEALERIGSVGTLRNQSVSASDVTGRIVDLESQIKTMEASIERLRAFLENATDTKAVTELETALVERETRLEQLRGQLRTLQRQVALATITVRLVEFVNRAVVVLETSAYPGADDDGLSCPGSESVTVVRGDEVTLCFEVRNVGDTKVRIVDLRDPVLDLSLADLDVVFGVAEAELEPGESVMFATSRQVERTLRTRTTAVARAVGEGGEELTGRDAVANVTSSMELRAVIPEGVPGFFDGLQRSWRFLIRLFQLTLLAIGVFLPFAWVPVVVWLLVRWFARSRWEGWASRGRSGRPPTGGSAGEVTDASEDGETEAEVDST